MKNPARVKSLQRALEFEAGTQLIFSLLDKVPFSPSWALVTGSHGRHSEVIKTVVTTCNNSKPTQNNFMFSLSLLTKAILEVLVLRLEDKARLIDN